MGADASGACCSGPRRPDDAGTAAAPSAASPASSPATAPTAYPGASAGRAREEARDVVRLPGGVATLGDHFDEGYATDGERPVHRVRLGAFDMDRGSVTNRQFAAFVAATGYVTMNERLGHGAVFYLHARGNDADVLGQADGAPWWLSMRGADWAHPTGPGSGWEAIPEHPVVQVSWDDALAYSAWLGRALPTEAQWEYAARGGLEGARFAWGDVLTPVGRHRCNIWQGEFPVLDSGEDGFIGTSPVGAFPPNGFGLHDMAGNVWQWCADAFRVDAYSRRLAAASPGEPPGDPATDPVELEFGAETARVIRGGSHLCHDSYCHRYRVAARSRAHPASASSNTGFRTVSAPLGGTA